MQKLLGYLRGLLRGEDAILMVIPFCLVFLAHKPKLMGWIERLVGGGTLYGINGVILLFSALGFWACLATRPDPDPIENKNLWERLHLYSAYAALVFGVPILGLLVADGRSGTVYIWASLFGVGSLASLIDSFSGTPRRYPFETRRLWLLPFLFASAWNCLSVMTDQFLYGERHVSRVVDSLVSGQFVDLAALLIEYGFQAGLFVVPYLVLVVFPRFVAGEIERPWVWIQRYIWFQLSLFIGLIYASVLAWMGT